MARKEKKSVPYLKKKFKEATKNPFQMAQKEKKSVSSLKKKFKEATNKANLFYQICNGEVTLKFIRKQMMKNKVKKLKSHKRALEHSNIQQMGIDNQATTIISQEDLVMEILCRLPVRSLCRFKCVSTTWNALISHPYFTKKHLNRVKNDPNSQRFIFTQMSKDNLFRFYSSSLSSSLHLVVDEQKLDSPSILQPLQSKIYSSCDGLVLLTVCDSAREDILLWNPSTRESVKLPRPPCPLPCPLYRYTCGLGYDETNDDYKILAVNINYFYIEDQIFSLKKGAWRGLGKYRWSPVELFARVTMDSLAFVHGTFHWVAFPPYTIVSFDISNEMHGVVPLLDGMITNTDLNVEHGVSVLGGKLCFFSERGSNMTFQLWVMKDYGVEESWTVLLKIDHCRSLMPKYIYPDGEVLISSGHPHFEVNLNFEANEMGGVALYCGHGLHSARTYTATGQFVNFGSSHKDCVTMSGLVHTQSLISPKLSST